MRTPKSHFVGCGRQRVSAVRHARLGGVWLVLIVALVACAKDGPDADQAEARADDALVSLIEAADAGDGDAVTTAVNKIAVMSREDSRVRRRIVGLLQARVPLESNEAACKMGLQASPSVLALCAIRGRVGLAALARGLGPYFRSMAGARVGPSANSPSAPLDFSTLNADEVQALLEILGSADEKEGARMGAALMLPWGKAAVMNPEVGKLFGLVLASEDASDVLKAEVWQARRLLAITRQEVLATRGGGGD